MVDHTITSWTDLERVATGSFGWDADDHYELGNDLDPNTAGYSTDFEPIADGAFGSNPFSGIFDGNGHVIEGLVIDRDNEGEVGLFRGIDGGTVENFWLKDCDVSDDDQFGNQNRCGAVAGGTRAGTTIQNVVATGTVHGDSRVGGFVGGNRGTITDCAFVATNGGDVSAYENVGGFSGTDDGTLERCFCATSVDGFSDHAFVNNGGTEIDCYFDSSVTASTNQSDAVGLTTSQMTGSDAESNMSGFDFTNTWVTRPTNYPILEPYFDAPTTVDMTATGSGTGVGTAPSPMRVRTATAIGTGTGTATASSPGRIRGLTASGAGGSVATASMDVITPFVDLRATGSGTGQSDGVQPVRVRSMTGEGDGSGDGQTALSRRRGLSADGAGSGAASASMFRVIPLTASGVGTGAGTASFVLVRDGRGVISTTENGVTVLTDSNVVELLSPAYNTVLPTNTIQTNNE